MSILAGCNRRCHGQSGQSGPLRRWQLLFAVEPNKRLLFSKTKSVRPQQNPLLPRAAISVRQPPPSTPEKKVTPARLPDEPDPRSGRRPETGGASGGKNIPFSRHRASKVQCYWSARLRAPTLPGSPFDKGSKAAVPAYECYNLPPPPCQQKREFLWLGGRVALLLEGDEHLRSWKWLTSFMVTYHSYCVRYALRTCACLTDGQILQEG